MNIFKRKTTSIVIKKGECLKDRISAEERLKPGDSWNELVGLAVKNILNEKSKIQGYEYARMALSLTGDPF